MPQCGALDLACNAASSVVDGATNVVFDAMLRALGDAWVRAASSVLTAALDAFDSTTDVDLSAAWFRSNARVIAIVSLPVVVALFVLQVITAVIRREPRGLARAGVGVVQATLGAGIALGVTQAALVATDEVCRFIAAAAAMTVAGAAHRFLQLVWLDGPNAVPMLQMILSLAVIVGALMLWTVLLFRKAALVLVAVFASIAFAGATWEFTRAWTRRWIEAVAALVFCKIVIVVVFVVGLSAFGGTGPTTGDAVSGVSAGSTSPMQGLSDLLVGLLLLAIAICAPWLTWRFVHWSGMETAAALHASVAASPAPAAARGVVNQAKFTAQWAVTSAILGGIGSAAGAGRGAAALSGREAAAPPPAAPPLAPRTPSTPLTAARPARRDDPDGRSR